MSPVGTRLGNPNGFLHRGNLLNSVAIKLGSYLYLSMIALRPGTPTIGGATVDGSWTEVASGLTNILAWRMSARDGADFNYAYVLAPGDNFMTAYGPITRDTAITAIYAKTPDSRSVKIELETWKA